MLAILAPNLPEWPVAMLGAQLAGGAVTPVNPLWTAEEIAFQLRDSGAREVLTIGRRSLTGRWPRPAGGPVIVLGEAPEGTSSVRDLVTRHGAAPGVRIDPATDVAMLPYSSGTTGLPKGVRLTHRNLVANVLPDRGGARDATRTT